VFEIQVKGHYGPRVTSAAVGFCEQCDAFLFNEALHKTADMAGRDSPNRAWIFRSPHVSWQRALFFSRE
jgi:hypothetical protein